MDLKLKICGMRDPENIKEIARLDPDYLGLIFYKGSPRFVDQKIENLELLARKTGIFVDATEEEILEKQKLYDLAAIQLHGDESPEFCGNLKKAFSEVGQKVELIKVFSVKEEFDFSLLKPYEKLVDLFLFDTKGKNKGGNGITFNWQILKDYPSGTPFFLSGGIGPEEIPAIKELFLELQKRQKEHLFYGIDVNSKFETAPAFKDLEKLTAFRKELFS